MERREIVVIGAGPAGLSAAIEAASAGSRVLVIDENSKPGGQLFKQIHKFFGSREHLAGIRGIDIGRQLLDKAKELEIEVWLDSEVCGIFEQKKIWVVKKGSQSVLMEADRIILATGASENAVSFPGWHLPGVMGAGAAQTMINIHRVLPGQKVLMIGSGNVGVIVSYQLLQAGADVVAVVEGSARLGGYGVHTAKIRRAGVPFFVSHTVAAAEGSGRVEKAIIVQVDTAWNPVKGTEKEFEVDTICIAAGLTPLAELAYLSGCDFTYTSALGGHVPWHNRQMRTSLGNLYIAGDISGVEEASTAMEEGRMAGLHASASLGYVSGEALENREKAIQERLDALRSGFFGEKRMAAKNEIFASYRSRQ